MEGHLGSFRCDHCITVRIPCLLQRFEVDSCVSNMIRNIHCTCLVFGGIRQVGAYKECSFYCSRFEPATTGPVLQDHWSLVLCTHCSVSMLIQAPLRPLAARTLTVRPHFPKPLHPSSARAQKPATSPLTSSKRLVSNVSSLSVNFTASIFSTWAPVITTLGTLVDPTLDPIYVRGGF